MALLCTCKFENSRGKDATSMSSMLRLVKQLNEIKNIRAECCVSASEVHIVYSPSLLTPVHCRLHAVPFSRGSQGGHSLWSSVVGQWAGPLWSCRHAQSHQPQAGQR